LNRSVSIHIVFIIYILVRLPAEINAQHRITLQLELPAMIQADTTNYYMPADLSKWNPRDTTYRFSYRDKSLELDIPFADSIVFQFKITRGDWSKGECDEDGYGAPNRIILVHNDTVIMVKVLGWTDQVSRKHTASPHVQLLSDSFPMHALQSSRRIWVYLPPSCHHSRKHYPVIYMNDGQNLFDRASAAFGTEWKADETMDSVITNHMSTSAHPLFEMQISVSPQDIDNLGHVNNVVYLRWVQDVAEAHWNRLASAELQKNLAWVVLRHEINYHKPAFLNDKIIARTWVGETAGFRSVRHVEIFNANDVLLVAACTTWCLIDPVTGRPKKITDEVKDSLLYKA
jgi:acyl-CoA thioester hydrolase